jgi:hypothetical protein
MKIIEFAAALAVVLQPICWSNGAEKCSDYRCNGAWVHPADTF